MGLIDEILYRIFRPRIEKVEKEFEHRKLRDAYVYYDLTLRVSDLEDFKRYITDTLVTGDYKVDLSEYTKFEELGELDLLFQTSRSKPIKILIRGVKKYIKGLKYPFLFAVSFILTIIFLILYILVKLDIILADSDLILWVLVLFASLTIIFLLLREIIRLFIYVKVLGIYDIENQVSDVRVIISGKLDKKDEKALDILKEDISAIYSIVSKKYTRISKEEYSSRLPKEDLTRILRKIKEIQDAIAKLEIRYAKGEISSLDYHKLKSNLETELAKYKLLMDMYV